MANINELRFRDWLGEGWNPFSRAAQPANQQTLPANVPVTVVPPRPNKDWWHRGVRGNDFNIPSDAMMAQYQKAVDIYSQWRDAGSAQPKPAEVEQAHAYWYKFSKLMKDQMFQQDMSSIEREFSGNGTGTVFSIQIPFSASKNYMGQGSRMSASPYLTIPSMDLANLIKQYPYQTNPIGTALQKFGNGRSAAGR